jgi:hypothetical protein
MLFLDRDQEKMGGFTALRAAGGTVVFLVQVVGAADIRA